MLYYDRTGISEGIRVHKKSESRGCNIWYYWDFLNKGFKFQPYASNRCHDLLMMSMSLSDSD